MKAMSLFLVSLTLILMGCTKQSVNGSEVYEQTPISDRNTHEQSNPSEENTGERADMRVTFDLENTKRVIQEALGSDERGTRLATLSLQDAGVRGAIRVKVIVRSGDIGEDGYPNAHTILEVESEDHRVYQVHLNGRYLVDLVVDMETGNSIFSIAPSFQFDDAQSANDSTSG